MTTFWAFLKHTFFEVKLLFWGNFCKKIGYFSFKHLVALVWSSTWYLDSWEAKAQNWPHIWHNVKLDDWRTTVRLLTRITKFGNFSFLQKDQYQNLVKSYYKFKYLRKKWSPPVLWLAQNGSKYIQKICCHSFFVQKSMVLDGWAGGWMGWQSRVKDCLQQSKVCDNTSKVQYNLKRLHSCHKLVLAMFVCPV